MKWSSFWIIWEWSTASSATARRILKVTCLRCSQISGAETQPQMENKCLICASYVSLTVTCFSQGASGSQTIWRGWRKTMNLQHRCSNITVKPMDMERAAISWGLTISQEKVTLQCDSLLSSVTISGVWDEIQNFIMSLWVIINTMLRWCETCERHGKCWYFACM